MVSEGLYNYGIRGSIQLWYQRVGLYNYGIKGWVYTIFILGDPTQGVVRVKP